MNFEWTLLTAPIGKSGDYIHTTTKWPYVLDTKTSVVGRPSSHLSALLCTSHFIKLRLPECFFIVN